MSEFVTTGDGTITRFNEETGELYHNRAGAYTEALQNYVVPSQALERLAQCQAIRVLDVCFGLGYNTFVLVQEALDAHAQGTIEVVAVEIDEQIIAATQQVLDSDRFVGLRTLFSNQTFSRFGKAMATQAGLTTSIELMHADVRRQVPQLSGGFDFIFHDPFSPRKVPELWTVDLFHHYFRLLKPTDGAVLTYSSASAVRGGLRDAGFSVYKTTAVGAKNGGTIGFCTPPLSPGSGVLTLSDEEDVKLHGKSAIPYRDEKFDLPRQHILRAREEELKR